MTNSEGDSYLSKNENGIVNVKSRYSFSDTFERLESTVNKPGLTVFARIMFSEDAEKAGLTMRQTRMLVFGSPKAGTPVIIASPSAAIDLPLKVLVWADELSGAWLSYNSPEYLKRRHSIPDSLLKNISGIESIVRSVAESSHG